MLPSTGLFKEFPCPYYDGGVKQKDGIITCKRPYCHFKHVKKGKITYKNENLIN